MRRRGIGRGGGAGEEDDQPLFVRDHDEEVARLRRAAEAALLEAEAEANPGEEGHAEVGPEGGEEEEEEEEALEIGGARDVVTDRLIATRGDTASGASVTPSTTSRLPRRPSRARRPRVRWTGCPRRRTRAPPALRALAPALVPLRGLRLPAQRHVARRVRRLLLCPRLPAPAAYRPPPHGAARRPGAPPPRRGRAG